MAAAEERKAASRYGVLDTRVLSDPARSPRPQSSSSSHDAQLVLVLARQIDADQRPLELGEAFAADVGLLGAGVPQHRIGRGEPAADRHQQLAVRDLLRQDLVQPLRQRPLRFEQLRVLA